MRKRLPIEAAHLFVERFADRVFAVEPEDFAGRVIQIGDPAFRIGHDDPFLDRVENRLEKAFFLREAEQIILHVLRPDPAEAADQLLEKTGFHGAILDRICGMNRIAGTWPMTRGTATATSSAR